MLDVEPADRGGPSRDDSPRQTRRPKMKGDALRALEAGGLGMRLRWRRRELYERRFKPAARLLETSSQIAKVGHDIARIMTVSRGRGFGIAPSLEEETPGAVAVA